MFTESEIKYSPRCAPSILITFINMVLNKETIVDPECDANMYAGQIPIQKLLFACAVICVPWMLLAKPLYIMRSRRKMNYSVSICDCCSVFYTTSPLVLNINSSRWNYLGMT